MNGLIAGSAGSAWTFGGSILTFAFPMILFIVVAGALYVLYTKPESAPGHRVPGLQRSVSYTAVPGKATAGREAQAQAAAEADTPAAETAPPAAETAPPAAETSVEVAGTEGPE